VARARIVFSKQTFRVLLTAGLGLLLATCRDGTGLPTSFAPIAVAPIFPSDASLASFGLAIDRVRFIVVRPSTPPDTLADTTVTLPPDAESIDLDLRVPLISSAETLYVSIVAMSGAVPLFTARHRWKCSAARRRPRRPIFRW